ncbi:MAG: type I polyketide synthase, partial [Pedobacter sp.]
CAIGSVKSNIGHLTAASGVTGLIKAALSIYNKILPPSINYLKPNPYINFKDSSFYVNNTLKDWKPAGERIAGVSSFGVGGTNVHVILGEQKAEVVYSSESKPLQIITLSAKNESSLNGYAEKLDKFLVKNPNINIADLAFTLNTQRDGFSYRKFAYGENVESISKQIKIKKTKTVAAKVKDVVFMFPGQGSQFINMGKALYLGEPVFKNAIDECAEYFKDLTGEDILQIIYPENNNEIAESNLKNTKYSQPALFILGYAIAKLWMHWGVYPYAFIGHSIGEFVAAYFSGVFSLQDAIKIISSRGKLMSELPSGSMLSVRGKYNEIQEIIPSNISIAALNSSDLFVLAGKTEDIERFSKLLNEEGVANKILQTSHAFHSYMMDDVIIPFKNILLEVNLSAPLIPIYSTVTGEKLKDEEATNADYWANHLRLTVQFEASATSLLKNNPDVALIEMGPGNATTTFFKQHPLAKQNTVINSLDFPKQNQTAYHSIFNALGQLWCSGVDVNWNLFYSSEQRNKIYNLPTYHFNRSSYWVEPK